MTETAERRPYGETRACRVQLALAAFTLALYASYYLSEGLAVLPRLGFTLGLTALLLGLARLSRRLKPERRLLLHALLLSLVCLGSLRFFTAVEKSVFWLLLYGAAAALLHRALGRSVERRVAVGATVLGLLYALAILMGYQLKNEGRLSLLYFAEYTKDQAFQWLWFAGLSLLFAAVLVLLLQRVLDRPEPWQAARRDRRAPLLVLFSVILLCWLPYYICFFPGCATGDSIQELLQQLGRKPLSNHHPVMHQLFIRLSLELGHFFDSLSLGIGLYSLFQLLLLALCAALCVRALGRLGAGKGLRTAVLLIYGLYTINPFYSITMWKDVLFAGSSLLLAVLLCGPLPWETPKGQQKPWRGVALLTAACFFFCTLRNNGYYAFLLAFPFYILINRAQWKRLLAALLLTVLLVTGYHALLYNGMHVIKSAAGETLSVPLQQIARTVKLYGVDEGDEDLAVLQELYIPPLEEVGELYNSKISDPVKDPEVFLSSRFGENPARYLKSWLRLGLRHPLCYVDAFLLQNYGYWYPDLDYYTIEAGFDTSEIGIRQNERFAALREYFVLLHDNLSVYRPSAVLYSLGFLVWLELLATVLLCLKRRWRALSASLPVWALWLTTLASPVFCEFRYLYGLVITVPLFLALALCLPDRGRRNDEREGERAHG